MRLNKTKVNFNRLAKVIEEFDKKYSIKVGIIGDVAYQQHEHTDMTNADLGAIHEFGATINVTDEMRGYFWNEYGIHKSNKPINIPERSFLRASLLTNEGRRAIIKEVIKNNEAVAELVKKPTGDEADTAYREAIKKVVNPEMIANQIAIAALSRVQEAFKTDGFGKWQRTSDFTREHRFGDASNPTLVDTGQLRDSITFEVKEV